MSAVTGVVLPTSKAVRDLFEEMLGRDTDVARTEPLVPSPKVPSAVAVYVDARHQGAGVGRELYGELLGLLSGQGLRWACAGIALPNDASVGLHEAFGFEPVGVYREIGFKAGAWHDVGWWQLDVSARGQRG